LSAEISVAMAIMCVPFAGALPMLPPTLVVSSSPPAAPGGMDRRDRIDAERAREASAVDV
jgi:hypothetical protein